MAQKIIIWALPTFEKHELEVRGGGLAWRAASVKVFPGVLRDIWLVPDLWALYGLLRYAINDHPQTTPEELLTL